VSSRSATIRRGPCRSASTDNRRLSGPRSPRSHASSGTTSLEWPQAGPPALSLPRRRESVSQRGLIPESTRVLPNGGTGCWARETRLARGRYPAPSPRSEILLQLGCAQRGLALWPGRSRRCVSVAMEGRCRRGDRCRGSPHERRMAVALAGKRPERKHRRSQAFGPSDGHRLVDVVSASGAVPEISAAVKFEERAWIDGGMVFLGGSRSASTRPSFCPLCHAATAVSPRHATT
jgi:hypothetical protein